MNLQSRSSESKKIVARLLLVIFLLESCTNFNIPLHYSQPEEKTKVPPTTLINLQQLGTSSLIEEGSTPSHIQPADSQALIELPPSNNQGANLSQSKANYKQPPIANSVQTKEQLTTGRIISPSKISKIVRDQQQLATNYSITRQESRASHGVAALLINQICIAQGGHQVKFKKQEAGNLKAIVKENIPTGFIRKHVLPVVIESGLSCPEAVVKNKDWQKHHIKLVGQIPNSYVWIGNIGLSGGMMKRNIDDSSLPSQEEEPKEVKDQKLKVRKIYSGYSGPQWGLSQKEIEYIFKNSKDFVCILEFGGHFKRVNQTWENRLGWDTQQLLNVPYINFVHPDDIEKTLAYEKDFAPAGLINRYRCKDGSYCWIDWIGLPNIRGGEEEETHHTYPLTIGRDVTLQKLAEEKCKQEEIKQKELETALLTRTNLLAHMSHEIRTPLTGLLGLLELIDKNHLAGEDLECLKLAYNSGISLLNILNDILDMSKIEQNQVKIESIEFSPLNILQEVVQILSLQAKKKGSNLI